jgi:hypothetical protein
MVKKLAKSLVGAALAGLCFVSVAEPSDKAKPEQPNQGSIEKTGNKAR